MICEWCDEDKFDVEMRKDPYVGNIYPDPEAKCAICNDCYAERAGDNWL